jgi:hypothetical protein
MERVDEFNREHYTQVKAYVPKDVAAEFKRKCKAAGVSMASVLVEYMTDAEPEPASDKPDLGARRLRKREVGRIAARLGDVLDAEEAYMDRIPENLSRSVRYENADRAVELLTDIVQALGEVYP